MPDHNDSSTKEPQAGEVVKTIAELALKDEEFRKSLGKRIGYVILSSSALAAIELTVGIPAIGLKYIPLIAISVFVLVAIVEDWLQSKRPATIFYICPEEGRFIRIKRSSHPKYRQMRSCPDCGCELIRRCQQGKHFIVSPEPDDPDAPPKLDGYCSFCKPSLPLPDRAYIPTAKAPVENDPASSRQNVG